MVHLGDCVDVMKGMPAESVDAVVCDPPYGLEFMGKEWDKLAPRWRKPTKRDIDAGGIDVRLRKIPEAYIAGKPMQHWHLAWATEALRVLKPGGHLLAFGGTRTCHRLTCAIEDAGFEIRDMIAWVYGSGFPKSLDVSKAIDKADDRRKPEREALGGWLRGQRESSGLTQKDVAKNWPSKTGGLTGCVANWELGFNCPTWDQWLALKRIIGFSDHMDAEVWRLNGRKGKPGENWDKREVVGEKNSNLLAVAPGQNNDRSATILDITAPATDEARRWQGWGTALKPALEPITVARKPLIGTVAENVLEHGTGGLNIDGCRVPGTKPQVTQGVNSNPTSFNVARERRTSGPINEGRWPANLIHDGSDEVVQGFPVTTSGTFRGKQKTNASTIYGGGNGLPLATGKPGDNNYGDSGSAARFFYCAKASKRERGENNNHPTVKPLTLMRYLVRLVTPSGGVVLDPFMGSGTTGIACAKEGFEFIGIEREPDYMGIAEARIAHVSQKPEQLELEAAGV